MAKLAYFILYSAGVLFQLVLCEITTQIESIPIGLGLLLFYMPVFSMMIFIVGKDLERA